MPYTPAAAQNLAGDLPSAYPPLPSSRQKCCSSGRWTDSQHLERIDRPSRAADFLLSSVRRAVRPGLVVLGARARDRRSLLIVFCCKADRRQPAGRRRLPWRCCSLRASCWAFRRYLGHRRRIGGTFGAGLRRIGAVRHLRRRSGGLVLGVPPGVFSAKRWAGAWRFWPSPSGRR
ncbi:hypothetical protein M8494_24680 [Serratia ureilytica]